MSVMNVDSKPGEMKANVWCRLTPTGSLPDSRVGHTALYYRKDKKVVIIGGATPFSLYNEVWILNLNTLYCKRLDIKGDFEARYEHSAFIPQTNEAKVWVFGGANTEENKNDLWEVNLEKLQWNKLLQTGEVPSQRTYHTTTSKLDNKFFVFSGGAKQVEAIDDTQVYQLDLVSKKWSIVPSKGQPPKPRQGHIMIAVDDKVFCHGGMCGAELFDDLHVLHSDGTWAAIKCEQRPSKRAAHGAVLHNRHIYICGGLGDSGALMDVWKFCVDTMEWEEVVTTGSLPHRRLDFTLVLVELPSRFMKESDRGDESEPSYPFLFLHGGMNETGHIFDDFYIMSLSR